MKNIKGHFWGPSHPSTRKIKHFEAKKRPLQEECFEIQYTFPNPKFNKWKESQLDPYWIC